MPAGRPKGSTNKMPPRSWINEQLLERKFEFFDEFTKLYFGADDDRKERLLAMIAGYLFPKPQAIQITDGDSTPALTHEEKRAIARLAAESNP